jgi:hypothetical protein
VSEGTGDRARRFDEPARGGVRESVRWHGDVLRIGDRVRLAPRGRADIMDVVLRGRTATVESIEIDYDDAIWVAVVVDDDPGRDLGMLRQPGHRFFFSPDDLRPLDGHPGPHGA